MEVPTKTIEMTFNGETKVSQLAVSPSEDYWNSLEKQFREQFNLNDNDSAPSAALKAKYLDEEGDLVVVDTDEELRDLLTAASSSSAQKPLQFEFSFSRRHQGRRCRGMLDREERRRLRDERMMRKFGKVLTKEDRIQMREERRKKKAERQLLKHGRILAREERIQKRAERRAAKEAAKEERRKRKKVNDTAENNEVVEGGCHRGRLSPEERKEMIERRKKQRMEEREARKNQNLPPEDEEEWPADATHLYLDGNNMMFVTATLRNLTRKGRNRKEAEALLAAVARSFIDSQLRIEGSKLTHVTLIFDNTNTDTTTLIDNKVTFRICTARPHQPTSDDVLIAWAKEAQQQDNINDKLVFVTSDRALRDQLKQAGGHLMKPKQWLRLARRLTASDNNNINEEDLDVWFATLKA